MEITVTTVGTFSMGAAINRTLSTMTEGLFNVSLKTEVTAITIGISTAKQENVRKALGGLNQRAI
jgi:hypothetical protein